MKRIGLIILGISLGVILTLAVLWKGLAWEARAQLGEPSPERAGMISDEGALQPGFPAFEGDEAAPLPLSVDPQSPGVLPTPIPGESLVYFVPTDNDATATVLYLYNTDSVDHTIALRGFNYDGAMVYAQNIVVPATSFRRLISDSVAAAPPPSWATPAPITTNFTDFVYFASLSLPTGVKVEGYTLYNPGTGVVNPRLDQGAVPLRFSTDPATMFMPSVQKEP